MAWDLLAGDQVYARDFCQHGYAGQGCEEVSSLTNTGVQVKVPSVDAMICAKLAFYWHGLFHSWGVVLRYHNFARDSCVQTGSASPVQVYYMSKVLLLYQSKHSFVTESTLWTLAGTAVLAKGAPAPLWAHLQQYGHHWLAFHAV